MALRHRSDVRLRSQLLNHSGMSQAEGILNLTRREAEAMKIAAIREDFNGIQHHKAIIIVEQGGFPFADRSIHFPIGTIGNHVHDIFGIIQKSEVRWRSLDQALRSGMQEKATGMIAVMVVFPVVIGVARLLGPPPLRHDGIFDPGAMLYKWQNLVIELLRIPRGFHRAHLDHTWPKIQFEARFKVKIVFVVTRNVDFHATIMVNRSIPIAAMRTIQTQQPAAGMHKGGRSQSTIGK